MESGRSPELADHHSGPGRKSIKIKGKKCHVVVLSPDFANKEKQHIFAKNIGTKNIGIWKTHSNSAQ